MDLEFHSVKPEDYSDLEDLYLKSLRDNPNGFIQDIDFHGKITDIAKKFKEHNGDICVLKKDNKLVGMGGLNKVDDDLVELCKLHLSPELKGLGLGKRMSQELMKMAKEKGYSKINLHVTKTQKPAIGLYKRLGFEAYDERLYKMEHKGERLEFDTLFMQRDL